MSNDSLGHRAGRSSSGWQADSWPKPSASGNGGGGGSGGGFHDDSDEDNTTRRSPEDDFRDDDFDSGFGKKSPQQQQPSAFRDNPVSLSEPKLATVNASFATKSSTTNKVKKPIDLGAAAAFAAQQKPVQQAPVSENQYKPIVADLFSADDNVAPAQLSSPARNAPTNLSFDDEDDFDPRDSAANNNGSFGDFSAAFSSIDNQAQQKSVSDGDGDDFADFSSAFGGGGSSAAPSKPAAFLPTVTPTPVAAPAPAPMFDLFSDPPAEKVSSSFDLLGGLDFNSGSGGGGVAFGAPAANVGGLNFSPPPPLIGAQNMSGFGTAPMQANSGSLFDFDPSPAAFGAPQLQPMSNAVNNNKPVSPTPSTGSSSTSSSANFAKKPTTWDAVAGVNIDLDNLKLGGKNSKKPSLPMNALMTPTSSPTKGFPNQPPQMMKPPGVLSSNANNLL